MQDRDSESFEKTEEQKQPEIIISQRTFRILTLLAISASIIGFIILLVILVVSIPYATLIFPHGFMLGLLLSIGGSILLLSLIILNQESKRTIAVYNSHTNQK